MVGVVSLHAWWVLSVCMHDGHSQSAAWWAWSVCMHDKGLVSLHAQWVWTIAAYYWSSDPCPTLCYAVALLTYS